MWSATKKPKVFSFSKYNLESPRLSVSTRKLYRQPMSLMPWRPSTRPRNLPLHTPVLPFLFARSSLNAMNLRQVNSRPILQLVSLSFPTLAPLHWPIQLQDVIRSNSWNLLLLAPSFLLPTFLLPTDGLPHARLLVCPYFPSLLTVQIRLQ